MCGGVVTMIDAIKIYVIIGAAVAIFPLLRNLYNGDNFFEALAGFVLVALVWPVSVILFAWSLYNQVAGPCGWCGAIVGRNKIKEHTLTCPKNPLVQENNRLREQLRGRDAEG